MVNDSRITIQEQYAGALTGSLQNDEMHHRPEYIMAVALGADELGAMLIRAKAANWISSKLRDAWRTKLLRKAQKRGWAELAEEVADISLWHYLDSICPVCEGRGHAIIADTPVLEDAPCQSCGGTKQNPLELDGEIRGLVIDSIEMLNVCERSAARASVVKLKG